MNNAKSFPVVEFDEFDFAGVSDEAKALVAQLLDSDPITRIDAAEALQHPWIVNRVPPSRWLNGRYLSSRNYESCVVS